MLTTTLTSLGSFAPTDAQPIADDPMRLHLEAPIDLWDEAVPLGNGELGGLLWGSGREIRLSLDKGGLWDVRQHEIIHQDDWNFETMKRLVAAGDQGEFNRYFDSPYNLPYPTKIPGGRLVLTLPEGVQATHFHLDMAKAEGVVSLGNTGELRCFYSAEHPVAVMTIPTMGVAAKFIPPDSLAQLDYPAPTWGEKGRLSWMTQEGVATDPKRPRWAVVVGRVEVGGKTLIATTLADQRDGKDPLAVAKSRVNKALDAGFDKLQKEHQAWWDGFWAKSSVDVPETAIQRHYNLVRYFHGAASRQHAVPMPLQGVWTADAETLPPWKGDYHHALNTQATYSAYGTAGHFDEGLSYLDYNWNLRDHYRGFARKFYGVKGLIVPGVADGVGNPIGGWGMYSLSPTHTAWIAQIYHRHWKLTADKKFLCERAYPFTRDTAAALLALCEEDENGHLVLPLSASPEIYDNSLRAFLPANSNYDNSLLRAVFEATAEMAHKLGQDHVAKQFEDALAKLQPWHLDDNKALMFAANNPHNQSHRHHSHLMGIHPFSQITIESGDEDRAIIDASLEAIERNGTQWWVGYSFSWMSCIHARVGNAKQALRYLRDYERAFILRNGFHCNGDQIGAGLSNFTYRPVTLEGNFLAMEAVHQMLLQSWNDRVRIFPTMPDEWADASFTDLRAQGGFRVSATRKAGQTMSVRIEATVDQTLFLKDPFPGANANWDQDISREGDEVIVELLAGEVLHGTTGR